MPYGVEQLSSSIHCYVEAIYSSYSVGIATEYVAVRVSLEYRYIHSRWLRVVRSRPGTLLSRVG